MNKSVLVINRYFSDNLGDQAIGIAAKALFDKRGFDTELINLLSICDKRKLDLEEHRSSLKQIMIKILKKITFVKICYWFIINRKNFHIGNKKFDFLLEIEEIELLNQQINNIVDEIIQVNFYDY